MIIYNRTEYSKLTDNQYRKEKRRLQVELLKLQEWGVETNQRILILLEGRDAAGKGSIIKRFISVIVSLLKGKILGFLLLFKFIMFGYFLKKMIHNQQSN